MNFSVGPGERILWQGQPAQGIRFAPQDIFAVPFALFWLAIVVSIFASLIMGAATNIDPASFIIMPVFILVGLYMLAGRFVVDHFARRKTRYVLTNQRAILESGLLRTNSRSVNLGALAEIQFRAGRNGKGTVRFGSAGPFAMMPSGWPGMSQFAAPVFEMIDDAERVYGLALQAQRDSRAGSK